MFAYSLADFSDEVTQVIRHGVDHSALVAADSRESLGLPLDAVAYGCFNRPEKITPALFDGWLEILRQVPDSLLWIINDQPRVDERLRPRRQLHSRHRELPLFNPAAWVGHLESLLEQRRAGPQRRASCSGQP